MRTTRHSGQEVRFVDHNDVVVAIEHRQVERNIHLVRQIAVQVDLRTGTKDRLGSHHTALGIDHLAGQHPGAGSLSEANGELREHISTVQPKPGRTDPVTSRQWRPSHVKGTGSRISPRASGAATRSESAASSSS